MLVLLAADVLAPLVGLGGELEQPLFPIGRSDLTFVQEHRGGEVLSFSVDKWPPEAFPKHQRNVCRCLQCVTGLVELKVLLSFTTCMVMNVVHDFLEGSWHRLLHISSVGFDNHVLPEPLCCSRKEM